jgi:hypothetical protein
MKYYKYMYINTRVVQKIRPMQLLSWELLIKNMNYLSLEGEICLK